jgi:hypothetical protein
MAFDDVAGDERSKHLYGTVVTRDVKSIMYVASAWAMNYVALQYDKGLRHWSEATLSGKGRCGPDWYCNSLARLYQQAKALRCAKRGQQGKRGHPRH